MEDKTLNRLVRTAAAGVLARAASKHIVKASAVALAAEKKRVEDSKRMRAVAMIDGKVIGECYIEDIAERGPVEVNVTPLSAGWSQRITGQINKTSSQKEDMKAWKKKHGLK